MQKARLVLDDGIVFLGQAPAWQAARNYSGEVVFNTGMTGYVESLTDPSYAEQILVFTYPLIGNYGVLPAEDWESSKIHAAGVIVSSTCINWSHPKATQSLLGWLEAQGVPIVTEIDTRSLTKHLRERGTMAGTITARLRGRVSSPVLRTPHVSINQPEHYGKPGGKRVVLVDCGAKENIVRSLVGLGLNIKRVPHDYDYTAEDYDGVMYSNGPGDPTDYPETVGIARRAMKIGKPVFGICLGTQIMALAAGAKTYKLLYGHRGHNQPCINTGDERCVITSQNHGYAIDDKTLPKDWQVTFRNLNDNSVEGIAHKTKPFFSVQFHPEASPGPTDTAWLFEEFYKLL